MDNKLFFEEETTHVEGKSWHRYIPVFYPYKGALLLGTLIASDDNKPFEFNPKVNLGKLMKNHYVPQMKNNSAKSLLNKSFNMIMFGKF